MPRDFNRRKNTKKKKKIRLTAVNQQQIDFNGFLVPWKNNQNKKIEFAIQPRIPIAARGCVPITDDDKPPSSYVKPRKASFEFLIRPTSVNVSLCLF